MDGRGTRIDVFLDGELRGYLYRSYMGPIYHRKWRFHNLAHYAESGYFQRFADAYPWIVEHLEVRDR